MSRLSKYALPSVLCASLVCAGALAQTPVVERVEKAPQLVPLYTSIHGRVLTMTPDSLVGFGDKQFEAQWPGTYFEARFTGPELYFQVGPNHAILHLTIDAQPMQVLTKPEPGVYRVSHLDKKTHIAVLKIATESQDAPNILSGFGIPLKQKAITIDNRTRQIEFIGDSHTVGYGNTSTKNQCTQDEVWAKTDDTQAFGALTAAHYHADYQVNAISGRGIVRNYDGFQADTLPVAYPYVLFDKKQLYSDPTWKPQIIVIALGTNDFSTPLNPGEKWQTRDELHADYEATYVHFLESLRAKNPKAYFILWATDMAKGEIEAEVLKVVQQARAAGEQRLAFLPMDHLTFTGCHSHPSLADDQTIRDRLVQFIDTQKNIWEPK